MVFAADISNMALVLLCSVIEHVCSLRVYHRDPNYRANKTRVNKRKFALKTQDIHKISVRERTKETHTDSARTLEILDEIAKGKSITQRGLSKKLGIGLGMVNSYLNRLVQQGYIETVQAERKRLHYLLTPRGIAGKSILAYQYIKRSYHIFHEARTRIGSFFSTLEKEGVESIVLYKATVVAEIALMALQDTSLDLVAIVDDAGAGKRFLGYRVQPVDALRELEFDRILITTEESVEQVVERLKQYNVDEKSICFLQ